MNFDMRAYLSTFPGQVFPISASDYPTWCETFENDQYLYDLDYNYQLPVENIVAFNDKDIDITKFPTRIIYSLLKPQGSILDQYRIFPPGQFYDLDPQFGEIVHMEAIQGQLMVWQKRKFSLLYFNTTGAISSSPEEIVLLGNQGVLNRKPNTITQYGTDHKWSVVKGLTEGGSETATWANGQYGVICRFGADGTKSLSLIWGMRNFFNDNLTWVKGYDNTMKNYGIVGGWDNVYKRFMYSVIGQKQTIFWANGVPYERGTVVRIETKYDWTGLNQMYICTGDNTATPQTEPLIGNDWEQYWELIPLNDNRYMNFYAFSIDELKNGFSSFLTQVPKAYDRWIKTYLTPSSKHGNKHYVANIGEELVWWDELTDDGYVEMVVNHDETSNKMWEAIWATSDAVPDRVEFETETQATFMEAANFTPTPSGFTAPIRNNTIGTGENDGNTTRLWGRWLITRFFFYPSRPNRLLSTVVKYVETMINYNQ